MLHHLHPARNSGTDPVQSQTRHRAENECKRGNHLWLYVKTIVKKPERYYDDGSGHNRLRNAQVLQRFEKARGSAPDCRQLPSAR